ncbi:ribosome biogenesis GTP-binding protein YihA/YsxC [Mesoplasma coleopterae]|uniref:Probable GTP-binding protein EngB n=1 Tax=Mesoplasma coleopterae TaxID=324078 RepID=A0A2K8P298_9MOLU|nr:ribosome biogenesis GTP-binding protein YihA/YsxC [Mesoplasma coleopterae]ATZ20882.1 GTP-binding protein [Mesoplasma coleopterae]AVN62381.1 YihA family ribosome biogenesis GTP-binding protein [Mesoplasma coleopterae]AVN63066.1 YihA family ribosome biogenesis GTP-binding protein [Mesoplasma coleopterae]
MFKQSEFIKSAANKSGWIEDTTPEVCFVGRSNVGKSSFINTLANKKKLAKVANTPGKTRLLNFFDINNGSFRLVDAPGYGYAKISNSMKVEFGIMMEDYLTSRENLKLVCMLVDLRHKPTNDDIQMYDFLKANNITVLMIGTKLDKLKRNEIAKNEKLIKETLEFDQNDVFIKVSNLDKINIKESYDALIRLIEVENG